MSRRNIYYELFMLGYGESLIIGDREVYRDYKNIYLLYINGYRVGRTNDLQNCEDFLRG